MAHSTLAPVFTGLRIGLHALVLGLAVLPAARSIMLGSAQWPWVVTVALLFLLVYALGGFFSVRAATPAAEPGPSLVWLIALTLIWAVLVWLSPDGAYLVFPLFFLYLHLLPGAAAFASIATTTVYAIVALGLHQGFSVGGVSGPLVGAGVAVLIGLGYRALARESAEREALLAELVRTRDQLAVTEREQGALAERARLARDIHDTVAQGLSSIQMLLRAAEREATPSSLRHLTLARETAAESLAETRQLIGELTPERLDDGLAPALVRLVEGQRARTGLDVRTAVPDSEVMQRLDLSMSLQTALLRIAQGAISNVVRHAEATSARVELRVENGPERVMLVVSDDGRGFDTGAGAPGGSSDGSSGFGLRAIAERVEQLGGELEIDSAPGRGTVVTVTLEIS